MHKVFVSISTGYCGEDSALVMEFEDHISDSAIDKAAHEEAQDWALQFDHSEEYDPEENYDEWSDIQERVEGSWEDYDAEKHEGMY
jgi:hypothetical protein